MRHYEIVLIIHPDQSEQVPAMVVRYRELLTSQKGVVHRFEDWGRCQLAYPIQNVSKGHYLLLNIQCSHETLAELEKAFLFNDAVLRSLVMKMDDADTKSSPMLRQLQRDDGGRVAAGAEGG